MKACALAVLFFAALCHATEIGEKCTKDEECKEETDYGRLECVSGGKTYLSYLGDDETTTVEPTTPESTTSDPSGDKTCQCKSEYQEEDGKCRLVLDEDLSCEENVDCELIVEDPMYTTVNREGKCGDDNTCTCGDEWQVALNETKYMCYKVPEANEDSKTPQFECSVNQECEFLFDDLRNTTSHCNSTMCICDEQWKIYANSTDKVSTYLCERPLGEVCDNDEHCSHIEHSSCSDGTCKCDDGFGDESEFKCSGASTLISSFFMLLTAFWITKESY